jgi:hypothetical protein
MRNSSIFLGFIAVALAGLVGACATGPLFQSQAPEKNRSVVYLYRPHKFFGSAWSPDVVVDGEKKFDIGNGTYVAIPLESGVHKIVLREMGGDLATIEFKVTATRNEYYLRTEMMEGETDKAAATANVGVAGSAVVSAFGESRFRDADAIETDFVTSPFSTRLFFVEPRAAFQEIKDTRLAK